MSRLLEERFGGAVRFGEPLARHTSFRIGGPADAWLEVSTADEIRDALRLAAGRDVPLTVFGTGTNILVSDRGVRGVVLKLGKPFEMGVYPGEIHFFRRAHILRDAWRRAEEFFDRHLKDGAATTSSR